jgi:PTH1 family peptidyl-tRNA hydrolase
MRLFVGLGNPGERYGRTRHNLGFHVVDGFARKAGAAWLPGEGPYRLARAEMNGEPVLVAKPTTFMNRSGIAVFDLVTRYGVPMNQLTVVLDDFNLPLGRIRLRSSGSDGGHNGLASIIRYLRGESFPRLRLGIGAPADDVVEYVLSPFRKDEESRVQDMITRGTEALADIVEQGLDQAMTKNNNQNPL